MGISAYWMYRSSVLMPSTSSERTSVNRRASAASLRGVGIGADPRRLHAARAGHDEAARQHLRRPAPCRRGRPHRSAATRRSRDRPRCGPHRRRAPGRRSAAPAGRRARPPRRRSRETSPVAHDARLRRARAPRAGRGCAWRGSPARSRSAAFATRMMPNVASWICPTTRMTASIVPRIALKRVKTLARMISRVGAARPVAGVVRQALLDALADLVAVRRPGSGRDGGCGHARPGRGVSAVGREGRARSRRCRRPRASGTRRARPASPAPRRGRCRSARRRRSSRTFPRGR